MFNPVSTYRIQFHKEFTFADFEKIIPYLADLGIKTVYASPIFEATPGSTHGYDGVNPNKINPEIGTEEELIKIHGLLKAKDISWIQDIVPNHMAFHPHNEWLSDVLEKGRLSKYSHFFDILWEVDPRIMVPFLGKSLDQAVNDGDLIVGFKNGKLQVLYFDNYYPLSPRSYSKILQSNLSEADQAVHKLLLELENYVSVDDQKTYFLEWNEFLLQFESLYKNSDFKNYVEGCLNILQQDKDKLLTLLNEQEYRLCHWQETDSKINYRRFFTINGLICLNIQHPEVFRKFHKTVKRFVDEGIFQGLRIDHIDGLFNPSQYLQDLRNLVGEETYIVVEKILEAKEDFPKEWIIQGNTGYDFLALSNNLFTLPHSRNSFTELYHSIVPDKRSVHELIDEKKSMILHQHMGGELENLFQLFLHSHLLPESDIETIGKDTLKEAIAELLIAFPVYRFYGNTLPLGKVEQEELKNLFISIKDHKPKLAAAFTALEKLLLLENSLETRDAILFFYMRIMQFTGPLMAKGVEDTLMYTYSRFIGHNEVGDSPDAFGIGVKEFHDQMISRQKYWPLSVNATATHDTKRGEDASARLNLLSEIPQVWKSYYKQWSKILSKEFPTLTPGDLYFLLQTFIATAPWEYPDETDYVTRFQQYAVKALREGKVKSSWSEPSLEYETATQQLITYITSRDNKFSTAFNELSTVISAYGIINSLSRLILKFTCPGVPDTYQGTEVFDFSFVDPDNRRPVNYQQRLEHLRKITDSGEKLQGELTESLWSERFNGTLKLCLTWQLLHLRKEFTDLFLEGAYVPLEIEGKYKNNVFAFARRKGNIWIVVAIPLHIASVTIRSKTNVKEFDWKDTRIILPREAPEQWEDVLVQEHKGTGSVIYVHDAFRNLPYAVLKLAAANNDRGAGILLHITSLPSAYGIGDLGPAARNFADFLARTNQKYWQLLPLNPTGPGQSYSPYSASSSLAGNPLLISPQLLFEEGLLDNEDLEENHSAAEDEVDFVTAEKIKEQLFDKAFSRFLSEQFTSLQHQFKLFEEQESGWLNDYALYEVLKIQHDGKSWYEWPKLYKHRDPDVLAQFETQQGRKLKKIKWLQFLFSRQWTDLKKYCNAMGIQLFGDLPFYVSYDSADVWAHPSIFKLDEEGKLLGIAGVPPDYFNADGQLWGMPVFEWEAIKSSGYQWWIQRIKKNLELFDLLRLDHFRAFADYWEVPAGESTAKNGVWKLGPGKEFFEVMKKIFHHLPFIAEDLGDISDIVVQLREEIQLPGMKVLQFAFGDDLPASIFIPHNYDHNFVVYTGTHDNNTTVGWFRESKSKTEKRNIEKYTGLKPTEKNIHEILVRLAYGSVAKIAIIPMQDLLGLNETARMNMPSSIEKNWKWRLKPGQVSQDLENKIWHWTKLFNRK